VIEGVSYSQRDCLEIIEGLGVAVNSVRASGGGARSEFWRALLASILNKRVVMLETQEGSAYGAALLALAGTGAYASVPEVCRAAVRETASISPCLTDAAFYGKAHRVYQSLYPALKPVCAAIAGM
jgi:xylulokinase